MLNKFLKILEKGYAIGFNEGPVGAGVEISVLKDGVEAAQTINLDHAEDFGLPKEIVIMTTIEKLMADISNNQQPESI